MISLDERLQAVINEIGHCRCLADVGTDHGKIAVSAKINGLAECVIATDISPISLKKAENLAKKYGADIDVRTGDGIEVLKRNEYDCIVIAGMGGLEIIGILSNALKPFNKYVFVPHGKAPELRKFMSENDINPIKDFKVKAGGKYYDVISAVSGSYAPEISELYYGKDRKNDVFLEFATQEIKRLSDLIVRCKGKKKVVFETLLNILKTETER